jgi:hypothetical protein
MSISRKRCLIVIITAVCIAAAGAFTATHYPGELPLDAVVTDTSVADAAFASEVIVATRPRVVAHSENIMSALSAGNNVCSATLNLS